MVPAKVARPQLMGQISVSAASIATAMILGHIENIRWGPTLFIAVSVTVVGAIGASVKKLPLRAPLVSVVSTALIASAAVALLAGSVVSAPIARYCGAAAVTLFAGWMTALASDPRREPLLFHSISLASGALSLLILAQSSSHQPEVIMWCCAFSAGLMISIFFVLIAAAAYSSGELNTLFDILHSALTLIWIAGGAVAAASSILRITTSHQRLLGVCGVVLGLAMLALGLCWGAAVDPIISTAASIVFGLLLLPFAFPVFAISTLKSIYWGVALVALSIAVVNMSISRLRNQPEMVNWMKHLTSSPDAEDGRDAKA